MALGSGFSTRESLYWILVVGLATFAWFAWRMEPARGTDEVATRQRWAGA